MFESPTHFLQSKAIARWRAEGDQNRRGTKPELASVALDAAELVRLSAETVLFGARPINWTDHWLVKIEAAKLPPEEHERFVQLLELMEDQEPGPRSTTWQPLTVGYQGPLSLKLLAAISRIGLDHLDLGLLADARASDVMAFFTPADSRRPRPEGTSVEQLSNWVSPNQLSLPPLRTNNSVSIIECSLASDCDKEDDINWLTELTWLLVHLRYLVIHGASFESETQIRAWIRFIRALHLPLVIEFKAARGLSDGLQPRLQAQAQACQIKFA